MKQVDRASPEGERSAGVVQAPRAESRAAGARIEVVMDSSRIVKAGLWSVAAAAGGAAASYGVWAGATWLRYGRPAHASADDIDTLLETFMPEYEIVERHRVEVNAPPAITFAAACSMDLLRSSVIRAVFKGRELAMGARGGVELPKGIIAQTRALGWGVLAEIPNHEIVMGAATQPWVATPVFRALDPDRFRSFNEPEHVKIAWTLRTDPDGRFRSTFRTETRAVATDAYARARFRNYWALVAPGVSLIRRVSLSLVKSDAEQRARDAAPRTVDRFELAAAGRIDNEC